MRESTLRLRQIGKVPPGQNLSLQKAVKALDLAIVVCGWYGALWLTRMPSRMSQMASSLKV